MIGDAEVFVFWSIAFVANLYGALFLYPGFKIGWINVSACVAGMGYHGLKVVEVL